MDKTLRLYLVRPSRYDDEGYLVRHLKGVIPSNTLATLHGLTRAAASAGALAPWRVETVAVDEAVESTPFRRIFREAGRPGNAVVVALCGVQTNQMARALVLARRFREGGVRVLIGGFHVSGVNVLTPGTAPEIRELLDLGVHVVHGEVDDRWADIRRGLLQGTLPPLLPAPAARPDLVACPLPAHSDHAMRRFAVRRMSTIDASRGCPFNCSFCTIINVQGRVMRPRDPGAIIAAMRRRYAHGVRSYFFTDDNFARNPHWEAIFDGMAGLRAEGMNVSCMLQVDTQAVRIPRFVAKAAAAGCEHVFIGMESINPHNLDAAGKRHNRVEDFRAMAEAWQRHGVLTQVGYILGFEHDTPESITDDVQRLSREVGIDIATFFILMPLPGSADHARAVRTGVPIEPDLNQFDSTHALSPHPNMSRAELERAYWDAWRAFYTPEHMIRALRRFHGAAYWSLFQMFLWYLNSSGQGEHPMLGGFWRLRDRRDRRPGFAAQGRVAHAISTVRYAWRQLDQWRRMLPVMQEVWLASRRVDPAQGRLASIALGLLRFRPGEAAHNLAARINRMRATRADLSAYWRSLARFGWRRANPLAAPLKALSEWALFVQFLSSFRRGRAGP